MDQKAGIRATMFLLGGISLVLFMINGSGILLAVGVSGFVLGLTDFGRRCPLALSLRYHYKTMMKKTRPGTSEEPEQAQHPHSA